MLVIWTGRRPTAGPCWQTFQPLWSKERRMFLSSRFKRPSDQKRFEGKEEEKKLVNALVFFIGGTLPPGRPGQKEPKNINMSIFGPAEKTTHSSTFLSLSLSFIDLNIKREARAFRYYTPKGLISLVGQSRDGRSANIIEGNFTREVADCSPINFFFIYIHRQYLSQ